MEKIIVDDEDVTIFRQIDDSDIFCPTVQVIKSFDKKSKIITFSMWDDFSFEGYTTDKNYMRKTKSLEVTIGKNDHLYHNFDKLLGDDKEIIIDDDHTFDCGIKTMKIFKDKKGINIVFENNEEYSEIPNKFNVFIKNIMEDGRSKITARNDKIKERLIQFFNETEKTFLKKEEQEKNTKVQEK